MFRNIVMLLEGKTPHLLIKYNEEELMYKLLKRML